jgi:hypothetical protein
MTTAATKLAPCQLLTIAFDNLLFDERIWAAIHDLESRKAIRIIDAAVMARTIDDDIVAIENSDMPVGQPPAYGAIVRRLLKLERPLVLPGKEAELGVAMMVDSEYEYGMTGEELNTVLDDIPRRGSMAAILVEHAWALPLKLAVHGAGGYMLSQDFLSPEVLAPVSVELLP